MTEDVIKEELIKSAWWLHDCVEGKKVFKIIEEFLGKVDSVYILAHTPEQDEDIFRILVNGKTVVGFELPRHAEEIGCVDVGSMTVHEYRKHVRGKRSQLKLKIALDLAKKG